MSEYYKTISKPEHAQEHPKFLASLQEWIRSHNANPGRLKLKAKQQLQEVQITLDLERRSGGRFEKPEREFVCTEDWDTDEYGPPEMSKVVEEVVFDKACKGMWRDVGKKGHFKFTEYDVKSMKLTTRSTMTEAPLLHRHSRPRQLRYWHHSKRLQKHVTM